MRSPQKRYTAEQTRTFQTKSKIWSCKSWIAHILSQRITDLDRQKAKPRGPNVLRRTRGTVRVSRRTAADRRWRWTATTETGTQ